MCDHAGYAYPQLIDRIDFWQIVRRRFLAVSTLSPEAQLALTKRGSHLRTAARLRKHVFANRINIINLVGEQGVRLRDGDRHQGIDGSIIGRLPAGQDEAERASLIVPAGVDLERKDTA